MSRRGGLGTNIAGERAVDVTEVLLAAPLQMTARQHAQGRTLEAGRARQQQERHDRRHQQPPRVGRCVDQVVERLPRFALDVARRAIDAIGDHAARARREWRLRDRLCDRRQLAAAEQMIDGSRRRHVHPVRDTVARRRP